MRWLRKFHMVVFALLLGGGSMLVPQVAETREPSGFFRIEALMTYHQEMAEPQGFSSAYTPYFEQIDYVQWLFVSGKPLSAFRAMNTIKKMLQFDMKKKRAASMVSQRPVQFL